MILNEAHDYYRVSEDDKCNSLAKFLKLQLITLQKKCINIKVKYETKAHFTCARKNEWRAAAVLAR